MFHSLIDNAQNHDVVLCSEVENAANVVASQKLVTEKCVRLVASLSLVTKESLVSSGIVGIKILKCMLNSEFKIPNANAFLNPENNYMAYTTHVPKNCSMINPVYEIGTMIKHHNIKYRQQKQ